MAGVYKKVQESRLKWYGHVLRREEKKNMGTRLVMEVPWKEGEEDRSGGGWITSVTTCRTDNYRGRKRKTE